MATEGELVYNKLKERSPMKNVCTRLIYLDEIVNNNKCLTCMHTRMRTYIVKKMFN